MATDLQSTALFDEVLRMQAVNGAPYTEFTAVLHAGGRDIVPMKVVRRDVDCDYRKSFMQASHIALAFGEGTAIFEIAPFQDNLKITITHTPLDGSGSDDRSLPLEPRTYRAYLTDELPRGSELSNQAGVRDIETGNRKSIKTIGFDLEEVAVEQLRKQTVGVPAVKGAVPANVVMAFLSNAAKSLKLDEFEVIRGIDVAPPNNTQPVSIINIPDGTPVLDLPDWVQNEQGGIYSSGLGFFIDRDMIYLWPLYDVRRQQTAKRLLRIVVGTSKHTKMLDKTYTADGRTVTILSAGFNKVIDLSLDVLNNQGNAVRFTDAATLLSDFGEVKGNKLTVNRGRQNNEYASTQMGNGQNNAQLSNRPVTSNVYLEASKMAARGGAITILQWKRSEYSVLTPDMAVEILYEQDGDIRTIEGALIGHSTAYETEGQGIVAKRMIATTMLQVFVSRADPDYQRFMDGGGHMDVPPEVTSF